MALPESALRMLHNDEIINLVLDYKNKSDNTLAGIRNAFSDLKNDF